MSIEKRIVPFSRAFRSLIKNTRRMPKTIKDLKDFRALCMPAAIDIQVLKDLKRTRDVFFAARGMARDRPPPYDEGGAFCRRPIASRPGGLSYWGNGIVFDNNDL